MCIRDSQRPGCPGEEGLGALPADPGREGIDGDAGYGITTARGKVARVTGSGGSVPKNAGDGLRESVRSKRPGGKPRPFLFILITFARRSTLNP